MGSREEREKRSEVGNLGRRSIKNEGLMKKRKKCPRGARFPRLAILATIWKAIRDIFRISKAHEAELEAYDVDAAFDAELERAGRGDFVQARRERRKARRARRRRLRLEGKRDGRKPWIFGRRGKRPK